MASSEEATIIMRCLTLMASGYWSVVPKASAYPARSSAPLMGIPIDVLDLLGAESPDPCRVVQSLRDHLAGRHAALEFENDDVALSVHGEDVDTLSVVGLDLGGYEHQVGVDDAEVVFQGVLEGALLVQSCQLYRFGFVSQFPDRHFDGHAGRVA
ncbi:hypothetical protein CTI14_13530 [Methylobacterium radiotolerans]|nr:hypothetical protein CTI14_13530 [Methylobacterium radiotolerans]